MTGEPAIGSRVLSDEPGGGDAWAGRGPAASVAASVEAAIRIALWAGWTALLLPFQVVAVGLDLRLAARIPVLYHRGNLRLFKVAVMVEGERSLRRPTLYVANHSSYFDIPILAGLVPGSFVAKAEIRGWPVLGLLARLQRSVFVDRRLAGTRGARDEIERRLVAGDDLILFPEGTTGDGNRLLAFRTSLFGIADGSLAGGRLAVQPVTIAYTHRNGMPLGHVSRALIAWFGDTPLASHFWSIIRGGRLTVAVVLHPVVDATDFASRKALAAHCHGVIGRGLEAALRGHPESAAP